MAYLPPNTFSNGSVLTAADVQSNQDDLRVYLHSGIVAGDIDSSEWINTRHVQPPVYEPFSGVQHGVSGHQGGQRAAGDGVRLTFCTRFLTGNGVASASGDWKRVPNTSFQLDIRRAATVAYHYWWEVECGADDGAGSQLPAIADRLVWIAPYVGNPSLKQLTAAQEAKNNPNGLDSATPYGSARPHPFSASYCQTSGTVITAASLGVTTVGLCFYSQVDRVAVVNWGIAIEAFYL